MEKTLCLLKPDTLKRALIGKILSRLERTGLKIVAMKMLQPSQEQAQKHYTYEDISVRHGEDVRQQLITFITSSPIVALVIEGDHSIQVVRKIIGSTEPLNAPVGTIRGDFAHHSFYQAKIFKRSVCNLIHASASPEEAQKEISVWFHPSEILTYSRSDKNLHDLSLSL